MRNRTWKALAAACLASAVVAPQALAVQGGEVDDENEYANVAILRFVDSDNPTTRWRCTGTLVAPDVILTAAHCTDPPVDTVYYSFNWQGPLGEPEDAGSGWTLGGTDDDGSENIFTDPDWDGDLQNQSLDDLGIIVLDQAVTGIDPAEIAPLGHLEGLARGTLFTAVGYGIFFEKPESGPKRPQSVGDRKRRVTTSPLSNLTDDTIIVAVNPHDKRGGGGICSGDSGGPLFYDGYVVGVTSWGTSQWCRSGQAGYQRLDTQDALDFYGPFLASDPT